MEKFTIVVALCIMFSLSVNAKIMTFEGAISHAISVEKAANHIKQLNFELRNFYHLADIRKLFKDKDSTKRLLKSWKISGGCSKAIAFAIHNVSAWSINMFDAMAKPPISLQYLANHWAGGFEQCNANPPAYYNGNASGPSTQYSRISIYGNLLPKYIPQGILLDYGACVPDTCSPLDVYSMGLEILAIGKAKIPILSKLYIVGVENLPKEPLPFSNAAIAMISVASVFGFLMLIGTIYDLMRVHKVFELRKSTIQAQEEPTAYFEDPSSDSHELDEDEAGLIRSVAFSTTEPTPLKIWEKLIIAFSIYTNALKILDTKQQDGRLNCLDGIRFLSLTWVILGHTFVFAIYFINNIGYIFPVIMKRWTYAAIYNATFSVDSFFVLSGLLTSYMFLKETNRIGIRSIKLWILYFVHRYWRLTPPYMLVLGFYTAVGIYFSDGPFWAYQPQTFLDHKVCANNWWQNLLYINNFYNATNECMAWSWYLANDMQFHFIVAPLILVCMYFFGLWGAVASVPVVIASIIYTGITAYNDKAATILDMNPNVYFKPWCRVSTYVVGLVTGCLIYEYQKHEIRRISLKIIAIGWLCAAGLCLSTLYGIVGIIDGSYTVSKGVQAFYTATSRFAWSLGLSWVIFACIAGYGGWINSILSWKTFIPLSRLTYCAYLVHPVIMFMFYMSLRISQFVTTIEMVYFFIGHLVIGYMVAFIVSITWESPLLGMERILLKRQ